MKTVLPRTPWSDEKPEVFRCPRKISDAAYEAFNALAHRAKLAPLTAVYANRFCREESFSRAELLEIKTIMTDNAETSEIDSQILAGAPTLKWIEGILKGEIKAYV
jgi:hypothetical protein